MKFRYQSGSKALRVYSMIESTDAIAPLPIYPQTKVFSTVSSTITPKSFFK